MEKLRTKLFWACGLLIILVTAPTAFAWDSIRKMQANLQRSEVAHQVLEKHLFLAEDGYELLNHLAVGGTLTDPKGRGLAQAVDTHLTGIRKAIASEIALLGEGGVIEEEEEIERVDQISRSLRRAIGGVDDGIWSREINAAVAEEQREVNEIEAALDGAYRWTLFVLLMSSLGILLMSGSGIYWLLKDIVRPTTRMIDALRQLANGNLSIRIKETKSGEFATLSADFNRMAAQVQASAKAMDNDRSALKEMVADRTARLEAVNDELTMAVDRRVQFLADISHELRTPLAIIRGEAEVTLRGSSKTSEEYRGSLTRVVDQVNGMARLVDDLLYVARNESGAPKFTPKSVSLRYLIEQIVRDFRPLIEADSGRISYHYSTEPAQIMGDEGRLRQLLTILVNNAMNYSDGPPMIDISLLRAPDGYALVIADQGIGIASDELPHVFERYRRGMAATEQNGDGAGLGLPLAKAICQSHGAKISLESDEGEGTIVTVIFPPTEGIRAVA